MGACEFSCRAVGESASDAFRNAVEDAQYEYGHGGYTGTIAEKNDFRMIVVPKGVKPEDVYNEAMEDETHWVQDKWGPAGCIQLDEKINDKNVYVFFGFASE